jgi:uncharacterized protein involved in exopolysaccharide biosynthesis
MKSILATVFLRDDANNRLAHFTATVPVTDSDHIKAAGDAIRQASGEVVAEFVRDYLPMLEAEMKGADLDEAKATEIQALDAQVRTAWDAYSAERLALEQKYPGLRRQRRKIKVALEELADAERKRLIKD